MEHPTRVVILVFAVSIAAMWHVLLVAPGFWFRCPACHVAFGSMSSSHDGGIPLTLDACPECRAPFR